jgi:DNA mismatch repair protein MutS2
VAKAESYLDDGQKEALALLKRLEDERAALNSERLAIAEARQKLAQAEEEARANLVKQTASLKSQSQELDREVRTALIRHRREIAELKKDIRLSLESHERPNAVAFNLKAAGLAKDLAAARPPKTQSEMALPLISVAVGERVWVGKLSLAGIVKAYNPEKDEALVEAGGLSVKTTVAELFPAPKDERAGRPQVTLSVSREAEDGLALNLLGQTVAEAIELVDREIDRALLRGQKRLTIIHGLGTGRLRKGLAAHLKNHPQVAELIWPVEGPGGLGVTVVELS